MTAGGLVGCLQQGMSEQALEPKGKDPNQKRGRNNRTHPWKLVAYLDANQLAHWYERAKPARDLADLATSNPGRHALLRKGKRDGARLRGLTNAIYSREDRSQTANELFAEMERRHKRLIASGRNWDSFKGRSIFSYI